MSITLKVGDLAPEFELPTSSTENFNIKNYRGKNVVLYFYPRDHTPGCTNQAKSFRDKIETFKELNTEIIGISKDTVKSHKKFLDDYHLPFILLSDADSDVCEKYGVWQQKKFLGKSFLGIVRTTFLIDKDGVIRKIWPKVSVKDHIEEVINEVKSL